MKKFFGIMLLILAGVFSMGNVSSAAQSEMVAENTCKKQAEEGHIAEVDVLEDYIPKAINDMCNVAVTRSATISVPVTSPCDQKWRKKYPDNWMWQANRAVTRADDELTSRYGIYYYSVSQKIWNSSSTDSTALVKEAKKEWGLK